MMKRQFMVDVRERDIILLRIFDIYLLLVWGTWRGFDAGGSAERFVDGRAELTDLGLGEVPGTATP